MSSDGRVSPYRVGEDGDVVYDGDDGEVYVLGPSSHSIVHALTELETERDELRKKCAVIAEAGSRAAGRMGEECGKAELERDELRAGGGYAQGLKRALEIVEVWQEMVDGLSPASARLVQPKLAEWVRQELGGKGE